MFRKEDWDVRDCPLDEARRLVETFHYSKGGSNTRVYAHGLYLKALPWPFGVVWWLPPTRVACESVNREHWQKVLSLTRMVVAPGIPRNACSFLMARSIRMIRADGRFVSLVTYADESQGHTGTVYKAANWSYAGRTGPYPRWQEPSTGRQVACKAANNRTKAQMEALGYVRTGSFYKHKYVMHL